MDAGLVAGHRREDQLGAAAAEVLGRGQGSREDHRRGCSTELLCRSSCSTTWEAAPFTRAAKYGELRRRLGRICALPSAGPMRSA